SESTQSVTRTFRWRAVASLGIWLLVSAALWFAAFMIPLLLQYNAAPAVALVMTVVGLHVASGWWLIRWIGRHS
ncbi:MAG: hypothetical protein O7C67_19185, partial [Gammaproteobacteria bacterium]|nr:hypothetical protein [Gammaproteobacteria bacterium]